jgi:ABC-type nitrate/sulfonate/bicarbonate transport system substrate-binding protein
LLGGSRDLSAAQPQWSRPQQRCDLLSIAGSPDARFAALIGGSVDATVVNSPFEYRAEQKGFKVLLSIKETAESVKIPINGLST